MMERQGRWTITVYATNVKEPIHSETYYDEREAELAALRLAKEYRQGLVFGTFTNSDQDTVSFSPGRQYGTFREPGPGHSWY